MRWEGLKKTFNAPCCCHGSKIRVLRKKSSGRKMVKCKMTRYSEEDWKRRGRGTKKRAPFKTSQTFLKKKKKIQGLKERSEGYEVAVVKFSILEKSFLDFFSLRAHNYSFPFESSPLDPPLFNT